MTYSGNEKSLKINFNGMSQIIKHTEQCEFRM